MILLSLDISTSCTGWALWDQHKNLILAGAIETKTSKHLPDLFFKMDYVVKTICSIINENNLAVSCIAAEAPFKKLSGGKTTASTMASLIGFNFCLCYTLSRRLNCEINMVDVRAVRKMLGIVIPRGVKDKKIYVIEKIQPMYPNLSWEKKKTDKFKDWCGDQADAICVGLYALARQNRQHK